MAGAVKKASRGRPPAPTEVEPPVGRWTGLIRPWLGTALRLLLGVVFIVAGSQKVADPAAFVRATRAYQVLPDWLARATGYGLPYVEIAAGVLIILGLATRVAAGALTVFLVGFLVGIVQASARGLRIECGCFGGGGQVGAGQNTSYTWDILRDCGLLIAALYLVVWSATKYALDDRIRAGGSTDPTTARVGPRRTKAAQERLAALREKRRQEGRKRLAAASAVAAVVLIGIGFIGIGVQSHRAGDFSTPAAAPSFAKDDGILIGQADAKVTVDLYEDFICPACNAFEQQTGPAIAALAKDGQANFRYHSLGLLDANSSPAGYSSRAAAAAACMPDPATWKKYHDLLYQHQPKEGTAGLTKKQLISYGKQAGAKDPTFSRCVNGDQYKRWIADITNTASKDNINQTPTVQIDGKAVTEANGGTPSADTLRAAIKSGPAGSHHHGSNTWIVIVVIVAVVIVVLFFVIPRQSRTRRR